MVSFLSQWFGRVAQWFHKPAPLVLPVYAAPIPRPPPLPPPPPMPPQPPEPQPPQRNRRERRMINALERQRRKRDVFVKPQGPEPRHITREYKPKSLLTPPQRRDTVNDNDKIPVDDNDCLLAWSEFWGEFNFRDTILDQLDRYWVYLERMKKRDDDAYQFYKQVGSTIVPLATVGLYDGINLKDKKFDKKVEKLKLPCWFHEHRPGFGCYSYGISSMIEKQEIDPGEDYRKKNKGLWLWIPKFMYFIKYKDPPPELQPMSGGDIYKMVVWWDQPMRKEIENKKGGAPNEFGVFVSSDGSEVVVLRMIKTKHLDVKYKHHEPGKPRSHQYFSIPQRAWEIPSEYEDWARVHGQDAQTFLANLFVGAAMTFEHTNYSMVRVNVHKDDMTAVFGVNIHRMSYFFQDRDIELTEGGVRKRIFHIVKSHERHTKHGDVPVKLHFRGSKDFTWAGYKINITIPGKDHIPLNEIDIGMSDEYWLPDKKDSLTEKQYGKMIANIVAGKDPRENGRTT